MFIINILINRLMMNWIDGIENYKIEFSKKKPKYVLHPILSKIVKIKNKNI